MKLLVLALLIPAAVCSACSNREEANTTAEPGPAFAEPSTPATDTATVSPPVAGTARGLDATVSTPATAQVSLVSAAGSSVKGSLTLTNEGTAVAIRGELTGLAPGAEHGFHVHEVGECSLPDFQSAGEHFNPTKDPHGGPESKVRRLGDIPNARADDAGRAAIDVTVEGATLGDTDAGPGEIFGKALVVHAMPDDYTTQPSGGSGSRVACGVIR